MPKKIFLESFAHHLWVAMRDVSNEIPTTSETLQSFLEKISLDLCPHRQVKISWPVSGSESQSILVKLKDFCFYTRGDSEKYHQDINPYLTSDPVLQHNRIAYRRIATDVLMSLGRLHESSTDPVNIDHDLLSVVSQGRKLHEELAFHDAWARSVKVEEIDVFQMNESITAPEMRIITKRLGAIEGKSLLDLGCGLGEASVYFASRGAYVTAIDLSDEMLKVTSSLADRYKVKVSTIKCPVEKLDDLRLEPFDIVYVGNLFHHVDLEDMLKKIKNILKPEAILVSWDPVAYNPIINVYRRIATKVRTDDERPLRLKDLKVFSKHFESVELHWFWLITLVIFVWMALVDRVNPNKERYWKKIVAEGTKWSRVYKPLASVDTFLLKIFPFLRPLCWNVVVISRQKKC